MTSSLGKDLQETGESTFFYITYKFKTFVKIRRDTEEDVARMDMMNTTEQNTVTTDIEKH